MPEPPNPASDLHTPCKKNAPLHLSPPFTLWLEHDPLPDSKIREILPHPGSSEHGLHFRLCEPVMGYRMCSWVGLGLGLDLGLGRVGGRGRRRRGRHGQGWVRTSCVIVVMVVVDAGGWCGAFLLGG